MLINGPTWGKMSYPTCVRDPKKLKYIGTIHVSLEKYIEFYIIGTTTLRVELKLFNPTNEATPEIGSFESDFLGAWNQARAVNDKKGRDRILERWLDFLDGTLAMMPAKELEGYLNTLQAWRTFEDFDVFKTSGTPCVAFTAIEFEEDSILALYALGVTYQLSDVNGDKWWNTSIKPRLEDLTKQIL